MQLGQINKLKILRETSVGLFLGDEEGNDVLLPNKFVPREYQLDDMLNVFVFRDSDARITATTQQPKIKLKEFAYLEVVANTEVGSFVDWGLDKQLLVPFREQRIPLELGKKYIVYLYLDSKTDRLVATTHFNKFLEETAEGLTDGDAVDVLFNEKTDLGWNVIVNNRFKGLVYADEVFKEVRFGYRQKAYVKKLRHDGKLDISLQKQGYSAIEPNADKILKLLRTTGGFLNLNDNSDPEEIKARLQMSKKVFKKAIGSLYKDKVITLEEKGIRLSEN
jgi:predicted RNA-binding protein (virulence factor B family)